MTKTLNELNFKFLDKNEKGHSVHFSIPNIKTDDMNKNKLIIQQVLQSLVSKKEAKDFDEYYKNAINILRRIKSKSPISFNTEIESLKSNHQFSHILQGLIYSLDFSNEYEEQTQKQLIQAKNLLIESKKQINNAESESNTIIKNDLKETANTYLKKGLETIHIIFTNLNLSLDIDPFSAYIIQDIAMFLVEFKLTTEFDYFFKKLSYICHVHSMIDPDNIPQAITEIEQTLLRLCSSIDDQALITEIKSNLSAPINH